MQDKLIGYMQAGEIVCLDCTGIDKHCPVYLVNISPYSQDCANCKKLIVKGQLSTVLFEAKHRCQVCKVIQIDESEILCTGCYSDLYAEKVIDYLRPFYTQQGQLELIEKELTEIERIAEDIQYSKLCN